MASLPEEAEQMIVDEYSFFLHFLECWMEVQDQDVEKKLNHLSKLLGTAQVNKRKELWEYVSSPAALYT